MQSKFELLRRLAAEALGVFFVVAAIIGAGIMAQGLTGGSSVLSLLVNSLVCGAMLFVVITAVTPVSGGHLNPAWTLLTIINKSMSISEGVLYMLAQTAGAIMGAIVANVMFGHDAVSIASTPREGFAILASEFVASFGLIGVVLGALRFAPQAVAAVVGLYIVAAYWFTGSSSFASPAATIGRIFSDSYAGISPISVSPFVAVQLLGALTAYVVFGWLIGRKVAVVADNP